MISISSTVVVSATVTTTSVVVSPANPKRIGFILFNNSANSCYVNFRPTAASNQCTIIIPTFTQWVWPYSTHCYQGPISVIRNSGTGQIFVTQFESVGTIAT